MSRSVLAISWLNGQVKAVYVRGTRAVAAWTCPTHVDSLEEVQSVITAAMHETGYKGLEVVFVVENRNLLYHLQEAPKGRKTLIRGFIQRRVDQSRFFEDEPAAWGLSQPIQVKNSQRFLLTLLPRQWMLTLKEACMKQGLRLTGVFSPATVMARHLNSLPVDVGVPVMMTTELGGTLCLMVACKDRDSAVWFARSMSLSASSTPGETATASPLLRVVRTTPTARENDRIELEINRTRLFSQQQFDTSVSQLLVIGSGAQHALAGTRLPDGLTLVASSPEDETYFIAREAGQLAYRTSGNLLTGVNGPEQEQRRSTAVAVVCCMAFSIALASWTTHIARARDLEVETLIAQTDEVTQQNRESLSLWESTVRRQQFVSAVGTPNDPPIPALFLRYLGVKLPDQLALSRLEMNRSSNRWQIRIEGRSKESIGQLQLVEVLEKELVNSPFKFEITSSTRSRIFQENASEIRDVPTTASLLADEDRPFFVEGFIP